MRGSLDLQPRRESAFEGPDGEYTLGLTWISFQFGNPLCSTLRLLIWSGISKEAFSAFILPHGRKLTSSFGTRGHLGDARFVSCFFTSLWRLADLTKIF